MSPSTFAASLLIILLGIILSVSSSAAYAHQKTSVGGVTLIVIVLFLVYRLVKKVG